MTQEKHGLAVHHHRARAALTQPAAELGPVEREIVAQDIEQRRVRVDVDFMLAAVDGEASPWLLPLAAVGGTVPPRGLG